ncbi:hypothetical protein AAHA92_00723 [Salvia divinorum]|uniref:Uncharacterized protein n=1 Tax=Salvia divinorum TaxID=28513 RepID=A0ABD1IL26_SALDI
MLTVVAQAPEEKKDTIESHDNQGLLWPKYKELGRPTVYDVPGLCARSSGVGFNSDNNLKIECNDKQWSQIVKADPNAKYMRNKSWPYWEDWKIIFGKDMATDVRAKDVSEGLNHVAVGGEALGESDTKSVKSSASTKKNSRKRKPEKVLENILDVMTKMHDYTSARLETLSTRIGYDFNLSAKRVEVSKMLDDIPLLTKKHKFMACHILVKEPEHLDPFTRFSLDDKHDYLVHILEEKHEI